jgi:hypothetical protein
MVSGRWDRYKDKVLHVIASRDTLEGAPRASALSGQRGIEADMRVAPLAAFAASTDPRAVDIRANPDTLVIQNDGDEMMTAAAAYHLTRCEAKVAPPYYAPCTSYKLNTEWVQVGGGGWVFDAEAMDGCGVGAPVVCALRSPAPSAPSVEPPCVSLSLPNPLRWLWRPLCAVRLCGARADHL